ncbi:unnamed protein product, partial [Mesorhabditis belari]|uniref:Carboxylic ester hydrolase n=1 Tax=Mesorhabditis belari TaxID=2138241 RepID=A0AAF3FDS6_9BILA
MLLCLFLLNLFVITESLDPIVQTKFGKISGSSTKGTNGTEIFEFLGVPYAKAAVGKRRFEKPEFPDSWQEVKATKKYSDICLACSRTFFKARYVATMSEDCLTLNIWTPSINNCSDRFPVLFYIHGGSYYAGSSQNFPQDAARGYASHGMVVVSINYRLGQWGFLTLNDSQIAPNLGLWDQNLALRWVHENIEAFGGNKSHITLWGDSAGASSVSQHSMSRYSRDLFHQTIQMSGSTYAAFARGTNTIASTKEFIERVGCANRFDVKGCLQSKQVDDFYSLNGTELQMCWTNRLAYTKFAPIYDGDFLHDENEAFETVALSLIKPSIIGFTQKEGRSFVLSNWAPFSKDIEKIKDSYTNESLYEFIEKWVTNTGFNESEKQNATREIFDFFSSKAKGVEDHFYFIEQFVRIFSDFMFNIPGMREAFLKQQVGYPIYVFLLEHNHNSWSKTYPVQGSTHSDQYPFLMGNGNFNYTQDDLTVKWLLQEAWILFVKTGNPSTEMMEWLEFDEYFSYLNVKPNPEMESGLFSDSYRFWTNRMLKYSFDFIMQEKWHMNFEK